MNKQSLRMKLCMLFVMALLLVTGVQLVRAQDGHEGHDMSKMGKSKPKPANKPRPKPRPKPTTRKQQPAPPKDDMRGMDMSAKPMASPTPAPTPQAAPSPMDMNMPGMQTPAATQPSPAPQPAASPTPATNQPQLNQPQDNSGGHDMHKMDTGGQGDKAKTSETKDAMPGTDMSKMRGGSGTGVMDPNSLMVMTGEQMDIRVGRRGNNAIPMGQMGSGTSWQPATTPMYMWYKNANGWLLFLHGEMKLGVNSQGGPRGVTKFESQNWIMPMAFRRVGPGTLQLRGMFSLEAFTFPPGGSGQLFQTGETYKGRPIVDAQHPHDLFMELSATYTIPLGERGTWFAYLGYPGEPALGPVAFMHRWSASENPSAPLTHHLQDSTHITFGVLTTGFTYRWFKLEGSVFNGREPGENRYDLEAGPWNSRSARLSFAPNQNWAMQVSYGFLRNPEPHEPGDIRRVTASIQYNKPFNRGNWASSLIWGRNHGSHGAQIFNLNGYTAESTVNFLDKNYLYTRLELVDKNELLRDEDFARIGLDHAQHPVFRIGAYTFGYARDVWNTEKLSVAVGGDFTFYSKPAVLDPLYGSNPTSYKFFIRLRPSKMSMGRHTH
jgi:hypothetical protein